MPLGSIVALHRRADLQPYAFSDVQDALHWHLNMWKVRPVFGSSMLVTNSSCFPHRVHGGQVGFGISMVSKEH
jgi:hypothetical protein